MRPIQLFLILLAGFSASACGRSPTRPDPRQDPATLQYVQSPDDPLLATVPMEDGAKIEVFGARGADGRPDRIEAFHVIPQGQSSGTYIQLDDQGRIERCLLPDGSWLEAGYAAATGDQISFMAMHDARTGETVSRINESTAPAPALSADVAEAIAPAAAAADPPPRSVRFVCPGGNPVDMDIKMLPAVFTDTYGNEKKFRFRKGDEPGLFRYRLPGKYRHLDGGDVDCDWFARQFRGVRASDFAAFLTEFMCRFVPPGGPGALCHVFAASLSDLGRVEARNLCQEAVTQIAEAGEAVAGTIEVNLKIGAETFAGSFPVDLARPDQHDDLPIEASSRVLLKPSVVRIGNPPRPYISALVKNYCTSDVARVCLEAVPVSSSGGGLAVCEPPTHWWTNLRVGPIEDCTRYGVKLLRTAVPEAELLASGELGVECAPPCPGVSRVLIRPDNASGGGYRLQGDAHADVSPADVEAPSAFLVKREISTSSGWNRIQFIMSGSGERHDRTQVIPVCSGTTGVRLTAWGKVHFKQAGSVLFYEVKGWITLSIARDGDRWSVKCRFDPELGTCNYSDRAACQNPPQGDLCSFSVPASTLALTFE